MVGERTAEFDGGEAPQSSIARDWSRWLPPVNTPITDGREPQSFRAGQVWACWGLCTHKAVWRVAAEATSERPTKILFLANEYVRLLGQKSDMDSRDWFRHAILVQDVGQTEPTPPEVLYGLPGYGPSGRPSENPKPLGASPSAPQSVSSVQVGQVRKWVKGNPHGHGSRPGRVESVSQFEVEVRYGGCDPYDQDDLRSPSTVIHPMHTYAQHTTLLSDATGERPRALAPKDSGPLRALPQKAATCGHRHTGYGLVCGGEPGHEGRHWNAKSKATWERDPEVVRLKAPKVYAGQPGTGQCSWLDATSGPIGTAKVSGCAKLRAHPGALMCEDHISVVMNDRRPKAGSPNSESYGGLRPQSFSTLWGGVFNVRGGR